MNGARLLVETLRFGAGPADDLRAAWRTVDTRGLRDLVDFEGCDLWLYRRLVELGIVAPDLDDAFGAWLEDRAKRAAAVNLLVHAQATEVAAFLAERGVPFVMLKGVARHAARDTYPLADARATSDVDVLVRATDSWQMWEQLADAGYEHQGTRGDRTVHHLPTLTPSSGVPVELHISTSRRTWPNDAWKRIVRGAETYEHDGVTLSVPSTTELFWHGITHGTDNGTGSFTLRLWLDAAAIMAGQGSIDWDVIAQRLDSDEIGDATLARCWLGAAANLAGCPLPERVSAGVRPFPMLRVLRWRLNVARRVGLGSRWGEKLREEATRRELGAPTMPAARNTSVWLRGRRTAAALAARAIYVAWRMVHPDPGRQGAPRR